MPSKVWDEITYPFPNFNSCVTELGNEISNFIPHFIMDVINYPSWDLSKSLLVKWLHDFLWCICGLPKCTSIETINKTHSLWWSNQEPLFCPLDRIPNHVSDNGKFNKTTIWKINRPRKCIIKNVTCKYNKSNHISVLHIFNWLCFFTI